MSFIVRVVVWLSGFVKPLSRLGLCRFEAYTQGQPLKILLVGYNGARNTGADARVVALTRQLEQALGTEKAELTVMTLDRDNVAGYFPKHVWLLHFTTVFVFSLLRACSRHHVAILCEGSTLTPTFAEALCVFFCEAAGIMRRQGKPCIAYGGEVGAMTPYLERTVRELCSNVFFMARSESSREAAAELGLESQLLLQVDESDLAARLLVALDYAYDNREAVSAQLAAGRVALETRLHDMSSWFAERAHSIR